jgi:hypothetical protein
VNLETLNWWIVCRDTILRTSCELENPHTKNPIEVAQSVGGLLGLFPMNKEIEVGDRKGKGTVKLLRIEAW